MTTGCISLEHPPFKTTSSNAKLCAATRYSSYNNRWSDHVIEINQGRLRFTLKGDQPLDSKTQVDDDQWHHVLTTVGPGGQQLFVDGSLQSTGTLKQRSTSSNRLGFDLGPGSEPATVAFDQLQIYSRVVLPSEISEN